LTYATPGGLDDYSTNVGQMQSVVDPGEVGTESLPTDLAGELQRIRKILTEITGRTYWYESPVYLTTIASATTPDIFAALVGKTVDYTGTTTCTGFVAAPLAGLQRTLVCSGAAVFTAGANMLIDGVSSGSSITLSAGDKVYVIAVSTTQFRLTISKYDGTLIAVGFSTGDAKLTYKTVADNGWVLMDDKTIGDASSSATGRANADTEALFTLLWTNIIDQWAPVSSGRGGSAAADFAAHKTIALPKTLGRALAGYGIGTTVETCTTSSANGLVTVSNNTKWVTGMTVVVSALSGFGGTISATTYFLVRVSSTNIRFATTLALAQAGTPDITITGSGSATVTYTFATRVLGEIGGEEAHAQSVTELLAHTHNAGSSGQAASGATSPIWRIYDSGGIGTSSTGGNAAMNNMQPTAFLNVMCKL
jgi:hypothetical protein